MKTFCVTVCLAVEQLKKTGFFNERSVEGHVGVNVFLKLQRICLEWAATVSYSPALFSFIFILTWGCVH